MFYISSLQNLRKEHKVCGESACSSAPETKHPQHSWQGLLNHGNPCVLRQLLMLDKIDSNHRKSLHYDIQCCKSRKVNILGSSWWKEKINVLHSLALWAQTIRLEATCCFKVCHGFIVWPWKWYFSISFLTFCVISNGVIQSQMKS